MKKTKVQKREKETNKPLYDFTDIIQYRDGDFHIINKEFFYLS